MQGLGGIISCNRLAVADTGKETHLLIPIEMNTISHPDGDDPLSFPLDFTQPLVRGFPRPRSQRAGHTNFGGPCRAGRRPHGAFRLRRVSLRMSRSGWPK